MKSRTRQRNLFVDDRGLFEKLCDLHNLQAGFKVVKKNGGAPGIDGVTVEEYDDRLDEELARLRKGFEGWSYQPMPVRRVEIPKLVKGAGAGYLECLVLATELITTVSFICFPVTVTNYSLNNHKYYINSFTGYTIKGEI